MEDQEIVAAIEEEHNCLKEDELELSLGLRPSSIRRHFQPKTPVVEGSGDLCLTVPIWGKVGVGSEQESEVLGFEVEAKKEAQALRRQEARKKREEKRKTKANVNAVIENSNERMLWFGKRRAEGRENEDDLSERRRKKERNCNGNGVEGSVAAETTPLLVRPQGLVKGNQLNGLSHCVRMPGLVGSDGNALQPVADIGAGGFRPYQMAEKSSGNVKQSVSGCSRGSSPGVSDHRSTSGQGGSSSDGGSHSGYSNPLEAATTDVPTTNNPQVDSSYQKTVVEKATSSSKPESCHTVENQEVQAEMPRDTTKESKSAKAIKKPPKPPVQQTNEAMLLSQMPYVSTTGNGPNGKTITGFLYKYSNTEVCIVCVCHGSSFTPAGFVQHAGGVDVENPLRHITVVPFAFT